VFFWASIFDTFLKILFPEPQVAPVVNVTVNMTESKTKELTAGDHAKGLLKIGWDKFVEGVVSILFPWKYNGSWL
jgi:hypothetical protein